MQQGNTEKDLMDWFDEQEADTKWRISAYVTISGRPIREILQDLKRVDETGARLKLIHPGGSTRH